jgi:lipopolysaccharide export system protein LptA
MIVSSKYITLAFVLAFTAALCSTFDVSAQVSAIAGSGPIALVARSSEATPNYILYDFATITMKNGTTLYADELKAVEAKSQGLETATATGNVKAVVNDLVNSRNYTVTADNAVFDPRTNTIDLTGNVKTVITSSYTDGPLIQTGTSATVYLGKGPDFPKIDMRQVHAELTVKQ